jgi:hypothetical protein
MPKMYYFHTYKANLAKVELTPCSLNNCGPSAKFVRDDGKEFFFRAVKHDGKVQIEKGLNYVFGVGKRLFMWEGVQQKVVSGDDVRDFGVEI